MTTSVPNTPNELVRQNQETTPEEIWERVCELKPTDLQVFTQNCLRRMKQFHELVLEEKLNNGDEDDTLPLWVKDTTILTLVCDNFNRLCDD